MALKILTSSHRSCLELTKILLAPSRITVRYLNNPPANGKFYKDADRKKIKIFVIDKYLSYIKNYEKVLEKRFPKAMTIYRTFMDGVKTFYKDTKEFVKVVNIMNTSGSGIKSLTRREIELYDRMPRDMFKIGPVLIISTLPLANYVIFPLIYMYPKQILTSHFWNEEQKKQFGIEILANRLSYNKYTLKYLCTQVPNVSKEWAEILTHLKSGKTPGVSELASCKRLFGSKPFHLTYLSRFHVRYLIKMHDLHIGFYRRKRLHNRGIILKAMDQAILMEGGVHNLSDFALFNACIIRGLNPTGLTRDYMIAWLQRWIALSNAVDANCISLLLHAPLILGLNEKSNVILLAR